MKNTTNFRNIFLLLVASFLMLSTAIVAQSNDCTFETNISDPEPPIGSNLWCFPQSNEYNIRIAIHIVRDLNGNGGTTQAELDKALAILSTDFAPLITFSVVKIDDVISTQSKNYYQANAYKISAPGAVDLFLQLVQENVVADALNIYLGPSNNIYDGGIASASRRACTVGGSRVDLAGTAAKYMVTSRAISHEVGHLLNLEHTFLGTGLVNGQNCSTTGDQVCDTPADNGFDYRSQLTQSCTWNNTTERDANLQLYQPSTTNIMAYTHLRCMSNFTPGQFRRMYSYCLTSPVISPALSILQLNWAGGGCGSSSSLVRIFKTEEINFKVFPNPATEFLSVNFLSDSKETELQITDITGKSLYRKILGKTFKRDVYDIDFSALPKGIHLLTVSNELDKKTTKVVIQ
jgi:hypothetical protein